MVSEILLSTTETECNTRSNLKWDTSHICVFNQLLRDGEDVKQNKIFLKKLVGTQSFPSFRLISEATQSPTSYP